MKLERRSFLGLGAALFGSAATGGVKPREPLRVHTEKPRVKIGVIADPHIGTTWLMGINTPATEKAFRDFREQGVDAVAVLGDMTNGGLITQYDEFSRIWYDVFPDDKGKDGRKVEKLFITGNHDTSCWKPPEEWPVETHVVPRIEEHWKRCFHEEYKPVWRKEINGIQFVGINWGIYPKTNVKDAYRREILEPALKEAYGLTAPGDPVFLLKHAPPPKTCWCSGASYGTAEELYGTDERLFMLTGHVHKPITHPKSIWQGKYTVVSAGVITWASFPPYGWPGTLPGGTAYAKSQCTLCVYDDEIVIERKSTWTGERLGDEWRIPLPLDRRTFPYTLNKMGERAKTPYFAKGARVEVNIGMGENVFWKVPTGKAAIQGRGGVVLTFPAASIDSTEDLVLKYEATAVRADDGTEVAKENIPTDFFRGSLYAKRAYEHLFPAEKLPEGVPCRFVVRASDCFDKWSEPITSQPIAFKSYEV